MKQCDDQHLASTAASPSNDAKVRGFIDIELMTNASLSHVTTPVPGTAATDPAFGLPAVWIGADRCVEAQAAGYTVVDAGTVVATQINLCCGSTPAS